MTDFKKIRQLYDIWDNSFGVSEEEIIEYEKRFEKRLPEILRQYYLQFGKNEQMNQTQDYLILPSDLEIIDGFVSFYCENQGVCLAGIKFSDFEQDNPNIYLTYDRKNWELQKERVYEFLTSAAFFQALLAFPFNANGYIDSEKENYIKQNWKKLELNSYLWIIEFYQNSNDEVLALLKGEDQTDIFVATKTEEKFQQLNKKLNIEWDYNSLEDK